MTAPSRPSRPVFDPESLPVEPADLVLPAIPSDRLTPDGLRARFKHDLPWEQETREVRWRETADPRVAAVLVALVVREEGLTVLLTQRTAHLNDHAGQVSFPGGRHEPHDATTTATALREAQEEVGLDPSRVEVLGTLPEYLTGTGFRVTPVIGLVHPPFTVQADTFEVADIFEVPLRFLMDPKNHEVRVLNWEGGNRRFFAMPYPRGTSGGTGGDYFIWGATAGMLRNFYRFLAA